MKFKRRVKAQTAGYTVKQNTIKRCSHSSNDVITDNQRAVRIVGVRHARFCHVLGLRLRKNNTMIMLSYKVAADSHEIV